MRVMRKLRRRRRRRRPAMKKSFQRSSKLVVDSDSGIWRGKQAAAAIN
jgi:hypothetical protein